MVYDPIRGDVIFSFLSDSGIQCHQYADYINLPNPLDPLDSDPISLLRFFLLTTDASTINTAATGVLFFNGFLLISPVTSIGAHLSFFV
jgi:hypothetical protein